MTGQGESGLLPIWWARDFTKDAVEEQTRASVDVGENFLAEETSLWLGLRKLGEMVGMRSEID